MEKNALFRTELAEAFLSPSRRPQPSSHPSSYYPPTSCRPPPSHPVVGSSSSSPSPNPSSRPVATSIAEAVSFDQMAGRKNDQICLFAFFGVFLTIFLFIIDYDVELGQFVNEYECFLVKCLISCRQFFCYNNNIVPNFFFQINPPTSPTFSSVPLSSCFILLMISTSFSPSLLSSSFFLSSFHLFLTLPYSLTSNNRNSCLSSNEILSHFGEYRK